MKKLYKYILPVFCALLVVSCDDKEGERVEMKNQDPIVTVDEISPAEGYVGNEFTITGSNFGMLPEDIEVFVGGKKQELLSCEDKLLTVQVPQGTTAGDVSVVVYGQRVDTKFKFDVLGEPAVLDVKPVYGFVGDAIAFEGHDFLTNASLYKILFTGKDESALFAAEPTEKIFQVKVPEGALSGKITLKIADREVNVDPEFTVLQHAVVEKLTPEEGFSGSIFTISGKEFSPALLEAVEGLKGIQVFFDKSEESAEIVGEPTNEEIQVRVPEGLTEGEHKLTIATSFERIEQTFKFKVLPMPAVLGVSPKKGYVGSEVIVTMANMNNSIDDIEVKFGDAVAKEIRIDDEGNLVAKIPSETAFGMIDLTVNILGVDIPMGDFGKFNVLVSPVIKKVISDNALSDKAVQAGNKITITGQGLKSSIINEALYNGQSLLSLNVVSDTEITAIIPESSNEGEGTVILRFDGVEKEIVSEDKLNMLKAGSDISDYILTNVKQPFESKEGRTSGHCTPVGWKFNYGPGNDGFCHDESKIEMPGEGLFMNEQGGLLVIQSGWDRLSKKMNGKMFQTFNIPQGIYDVVIDVVELSTSGGGRKRAGLFISKGGEEQAPNMDAGGNWTEDTNIIGSVNFYMIGETYNENYRDQRFIIKDLTINHEGETTLGFAVHFDGNRTIKVSSIKVLLK